MTLLTYFAALVRSKKLDLKNLKHFVLDECDKMLAELDMRRDVQVSPFYVCKLVTR